MKLLLEKRQTGDLWLLISVAQADTTSPAEMHVYVYIYMGMYVCAHSELKGNIETQE